MTMTHRLILMLSGLIMMFAIFGLVMWVGAVSGNNESSAFGNMMLGLLMSALCLIVFRIGMRKRKVANTRIEEVLKLLISNNGLIVASTFAKNMEITLDDARDILDKKARRNRWRRLELEHYDAQYYID